MVFIYLLLFSRQGYLPELQFRNMKILFQATAL